MRMWKVPPKAMCDQHLLGEHTECHMIAATIERDHSLDGYTEQHILNPHRVGERHAELAAELERRGMNHDSPLDQPDTSAYAAAYVDLDASHRDLARRCPDCAYGLAHHAGAQVIMG